MKLHHIRSATFIIETGDHFILVDPMLSAKGKLMPFSVIKHKARLNPIVDLPNNTENLLQKVTHCIITHCQKKHLDHLDGAGEKFLKDNNIPVTCSIRDKNYLKRRGINVVGTVENWKQSPFLNGSITAIPAQHGHGWVHHIMEDGVGFYIQFKDESSIYISGDTVLTENVKRALTEFKPNIAVVACGYASIDIGKPILMSLEEIIEFIKLSPNVVFANHLEALNHCPMTRNHLASQLEKNNLLAKVWLPKDGENTEITYNQ